MKKQCVVFCLLMLSVLAACTEESITPSIGGKTDYPPGPGVSRSDYPPGPGATTTDFPPGPGRK